MPIGSWRDRFIKGGTKVLKGRPCTVFFGPWFQGKKLIRSPPPGGTAPSKAPSPETTGEAAPRKTSPTKSAGGTGTAAHIAEDDHVPDVRAPSSATVATALVPAAPEDDQDDDKDDEWQQGRKG